MSANNNQEFSLDYNSRASYFNNSLLNAPRNQSRITSHNLYQSQKPSFPSVNTQYSNTHGKLAYSLTKEKIIDENASYNSFDTKRKLINSMVGFKADENYLKRLDYSELDEEMIEKLNENKEDNIKNYENLVPDTVSALEGSYNLRIQEAENKITETESFIENSRKITRQHDEVVIPDDVKELYTFEKVVVIPIDRNKNFTANEIKIPLGQCFNNFDSHKKFNDFLYHAPDGNLERATLSKISMTFVRNKTPFTVGINFSHRTDQDKNLNYQKCNWAPSNKWFHAIIFSGHETFNEKEIYKTTMKIKDDYIRLYPKLRPDLESLDAGIVDVATNFVFTSMESPVVRYIFHNIHEMENWVQPELSSDSQFKNTFVVDKDTYIAARNLLCKHLESCYPLVNLQTLNINVIPLKTDKRLINTRDDFDVNLSENEDEIIINLKFIYGFRED